MAANSVEIDLIVGLGNPGGEHEDTRHNAGFWFVDELARQHGATYRIESKFGGEVCKINTQFGSVWLLKPWTYMNHSGNAVSSLVSYYKMNVASILVAHDDIDLAAGDTRLKTGGGHGGHNGLRDIVSSLGDKNFLRLRIGVGHPGNKDDVVDYVLHRPSSNDRKAIDKSISAALEVMPDVLDGDLRKAMHILHSVKT